MALPEDDTDTEDLAVEIVEEAWNDYRLEDGSRIRARSIPVIIAWPKKEILGPGETFEVGTRLVQAIGVIAPSSLRGAPNPSPPSIAEAQRMPLKVVEILKAEEPWNTYKLSGHKGTMKVRMTVTSVFRVIDLFDANGDPYYIINSTVSIGRSDLDGPETQDASG